MSAPGRTVFFLSDYGTRDEFVGVVHAVLAAAAPGATVVDLTHRIPAFDVRAGAHTLTRAVPHLGPGVVLAVVDPGVGSARRGLCLRCEAVGVGPTFFVGPDNGLLVGAAEMVGKGSIAGAVALARPDAAGPARRTFDGRDLFAPAAAALCTGTPPEDLGDAVDPATLVRLPDGVVEPGRLADGRACLRTEVTWVDHFGNVQLAARRGDAEAAGLSPAATVGVTAIVESDLASRSRLPATLVSDGAVLRCVSTFADLERGELGLLVDANDHLAVVAGQASAGHWLNVVAGELVLLAW
ncbi:MAG: S-adenosyl-l-methionine hydroxide adenosyltransferase family protein [Acidimicrobiales bacterium]